MWGDSGALRALASQVDGMSDDVVLRRRALLDGQQVQWHSTAADRFKQQLAERLTSVEQSGREVDELAAALRRHASAVDAQLAAISAARDGVLREVHEAEQGLSGAVGAVGGWVADRARDLVRVGQELQGVNSPDWLDVAQRLGRP